jgi:hypothetical protein
MPVVDAGWLEQCAITAPWYVQLYIFPRPSYMAIRVASGEGVACAALRMPLENPIIIVFVLLVSLVLLACTGHRTKFCRQPDQPCCLCRFLNLIRVA